jgi:hypothetical protein
MPSKATSLSLLVDDDVNYSYVDPGEEKLSEGMPLLLLVESLLSSSTKLPDK